MKDAINTHSISKGLAKSDNILLKKTPTTALYFCPIIHRGGVRGELIRCKINKNNTQEKMQEKDFKTLKLNEGIRIELGTKQVNILLEHINKLKSTLSEHGIESGDNEYQVTSSEKEIVICEKNKKDFFEKIINYNYSEEFFDNLNKNDPCLAEKIIAGNIQLNRKKIIEELNNRLTQEHKYHETKGDNSWQDWIYNNNWIFGSGYRQALQKQKLNIKGIMPDFLFLTADKFIDILEIKLPKHTVIKEDNSHPGSWVWSNDANKAICQVANYLNEVSRYRLEIEKSINDNYDLNAIMLKPRAYILIGNSQDWSNAKKEGLRVLNNQLNEIEIITYSDLLERAKILISTNKSL